MSRSKFEILGLNQEKVFNLLSKEVKVYKIKREHNRATFEVDSENEKKVYSILNNFNLSLNLLGQNGFKKKVKKFFSSIGLVIGCVICLFIYLIQYNFVLKIEVWGNEEVSSSEIKSYANEILTSRFKGDINTKQVEEKIKKKFEVVSSVSVAIVGQTLVINLNEADIPSEMKGEFEPLVSQEDGIITKISLIQGTLNVKVGDIVKKGDVLVYPYIIDTDGEERKVQPQAEIEADVWLRKEYCHKDYVLKTQRTGRTSQVATVLLFGKEIYRYKSKIEFEFFEEEKNSQDLIINNIIPFKLERKICYELENVEIIKPFDENKSEILELARQNVLIFLKKNEIIKDEKYFVREGGGCHFVDYIITVSREIGG